MAIRAFNSVSGFSVGDVPANIILANGDITAANATFSGNTEALNANLGNLAIANYVNVAANAVISNLTINLEISGNTANFTGNIAPEGILTDNYYYANGDPVDFEQPAGSNTQIQYNDNQDFGASANLTFDFANNILTVIGNLSASNANLGNLAEANFLNVASNIETGAILTDNYYYANGDPVDFQQPGGSNTQIQYNNNQDFGASANLTFDFANNILTVVGNVQASNANLGNLVQANYVNVANQINGNIGNFSGNITALNANLGNLVEANYVNVANQINGNIANFSGNLTAGNANLGNSANASYFVGNGFYLTDINTSLLSNGNSNLVIFNNANAVFSITGVSNVLTIASNGIFIDGNILANTITANANLVGNLLSVTNANITGNANIGTVYTGVITAPTSNVAISAAAGDNFIQLQPTGNGTVDVGNKRITSLLTPNNATDAATKAYVDSVAEGLHVHPPANAASTTDLANIVGSTPIYYNGIDGVGATITIPFPGFLDSLDGVILTANMRLLIKNEANQAWNGVYVYDSTTLITRADDMDTAAGLAGGDFIFVTAGNTYADTGWVQTTDNVVVGTSNIVFVQFSGSGTYTAGPGLTLNGSQFSVNVDDNTTAIVGGNVVVKASANLTTPNIGAAIGASLDLTGNILANNISANYELSTNSLSVIANANVGSLNATTTINFGTGLGANGVFGTLGQFLTADGTGNAAWVNSYYYGASPPDNPNYGDIWFYLDDTQDPPTALLYMWVTDGVSDFFYDFLPPNFQNI